MENEEELVYEVPQEMPLVAQSLKIEFSHNNCALQEVFFFQAWIWQKIGLPGLPKRENEEELF